ncbi:single-stranded-DNA-specific exonuclease RecJ [Virgibacillus sp. 179-BFC.A HS]|uniref:Single-stranded-DNA-specific exonuclease RecJ n=1 Tax=Tigheibacillus jepli TaxID=3035914 RepID=A0ABU5CI34_9BACI|nr:single-stranded-DNA-specific exonuclease RecJ [Virgibacillus sp. 179-BFC.A HS]MDY0405479.1 single-stranded-DNA-specific exonuclease RecJ [Virgibacillus sp. 179-BFC.A HS]
MLQSQMNWKFVSSDRSENEKWQDHKGNDLSPVVQHLLLQRGITSQEQADAFLYPNLDDLHDPKLFSSMEIAGERVHKAINNKEKILVFGDYDADGVSSTTVMMEALTELGADCAFYIPNRFTEGYGPNEAAFRQAQVNGFGLIITVDTGIAAVDEAAVAKELGIDLIITDHHEVQEQLPQAYAIIHPKVSANYPFKELAGVGVAFKFAQFLLGYFPTHLLDLAAIGTIADLVPLRGENRIIAYHGLRQLSITKRKGLHALKKYCRLSENVTEEDVGFQIGPHLNAVGRLRDADLAVELLTCDNEDQADELAAMVQSLNNERKSIVAEIAKEAEAMLDTSGQDTGVIVVAKSGWNEGVLGIVASRLVRKFDRPAIVLSINEETQTAKGSARSIPAFDLFKGCMELKEVFTNFGGHSQAAGMTLPLENIDKLRDGLHQIISRDLTEDDFKQELVIDASLRPSEINLDLISDLNLLAPFGMKNSKPVFHVMGVSADMRKLGNEKKHLKLQLKSDDKSLEGIGFGLGEFCDYITPNAKLSVVGHLSINEWNGIRKPQLILQDLRIDDWQLFDHRGKKDFKPDAFAKRNWSVAVIRQQREIDVGNHSMPCTTYQEASCLDEVQELFLYDLPDNLSQLAEIIRHTKPKNIHACFHVENSTYLSAFPNRNDFKSLYAYLFKYKKIRSNKELQVLSAAKNWSDQNIKFMLRVFLELDFVKLDNGTITLSENPMKKDLTESEVYQQRQKQMKIEEILCYSTYDKLQKWFAQFMESTEKSEEEMAYGL